MKLLGYLDEITIMYQSFIILLKQRVIYKYTNIQKMKPEQLPIEPLLNMCFCSTKTYPNHPYTYIKGNRGHNSCFLKKPITEGNFYIEIVGRSPSIQVSKQYKNSPSFRVGIAPMQYYYNYPLGLDFSVGYRMDGAVVQNGRIATYLSGFKFGDVIGIGVGVQEAYKYRDVTKRAQKSYVEFFINGVSAGPKQHLLTQDFYTFSASMYNQSQVSFKIWQKEMSYLPKNYQAYQCYLLQKFKYKEKQLQIIQEQIENSLKEYMKEQQRQKKQRQSSSTKSQSKYSHSHSHSCSYSQQSK